MLGRDRPAAACPGRAPPRIPSRRRCDAGSRPARCRASGARGRLVQALQAPIAFAHAIVVHRRDVGPLQREIRNISTVHRPAAQRARSTRRRTGARHRRGSGPRRPRPPARCRGWRSFWPTAERCCCSSVASNACGLGSPCRGTAPASAPGWLRRRGVQLLVGDGAHQRLIRFAARRFVAAGPTAATWRASRRPGRPEIGSAPVGARNRSAGMAVRGISVLLRVHHGRDPGVF